MKKHIFSACIILSILFCSISQELNGKTIEGKEAPPLNGIKFIDNKLPDITNKFVLIDFWATWCGPCIKSLPHINDIAQKRKNDIVFMAISDEKEEIVKKFLSKRDLSDLFFGLDVQKNLYSSLNFKSIPHYCLISPDNKIIASGNSSDLSENYIDSVITEHKAAKLQISSPVTLTLDIGEKVSSVEIFESPDSKPFLSQSGYTFIVRDSLKKILPYLSGDLQANRVNTDMVPPKMIQVKIFSRNTSFESLKNTAYNQLLESYGLTEKNEAQEMSVYHFCPGDSINLMNKNTIVEKGVLKKRNKLNSTTFRFDNYTFREVVEFLESAYFPRIFYAKSNDNNEYDWDLEILNPATEAWIGFEDLVVLLRNNYGIDIKEINQKETITLYN